MASVPKQEIKAEVGVGIRDIDAEVESKESRRERKRLAKLSIADSAIQRPKKKRKRIEGVEVLQ